MLLVHHSFAVLVDRGFMTSVRHLVRRALSCDGQIHAGLNAAASVARHPAVNERQRRRLKRAYKDTQAIAHGVVTSNDDAM